MFTDRTCLQCGTVLTGRPDKRFCDYICRNDYHNSLYREEGQHTKGLDKILKRNRRILEALWSRGLLLVERNRLLKAGFDFDFFTHLRENEQGTQFRYCYEYGYCMKGEVHVVLCLRKPLYL